ncbi:hypothetical protein POJ06DRAFT_251552 [Lipomyces tetrasporus]|uniref:SUZ domain-containing protein n=1 Tax=Lipomyces tetrasporus TaxID=54092 RepID=A0AAD7QUA9_9ASCO|nr:uncharacterized protein POJ06DRAFT_251552 [Lipomyces tetrasporus]KAJ8101446.1 hypothetical protein POJ06DRAFT_251552 [Lipomyces tetrasporus]
MKSTTPNGGVRIMRRETPINDGSSDAKSEASSVTNDSGAGNSKDGSGSARIATTLEERTAAYEEARKRIFKDFPESSVSGSDEENDKDDEDGKGSSAGSGGSDRKTGASYAADDEDFPRRSQYVPSGSGYYHVHDRNTYAAPYAYNSGVAGMPMKTYSAPNTMAGNGNDHMYNQFDRPYVPNVANTQPGYSVPRPPLPQQQYPPYMPQPQQQLYQQVGGSTYQQPLYGQSQPEFYGNIDMQNGQRRTFGQYQQTMPKQPFATQRPPYVPPATPPAQQSAYGGQSYPQYPQQQMQAQYTTGQQQFYIPPDQLQQTAAYKYQQPQFVPRYGANTQAYSTPPTQLPVGAVASQSTVYQQMQNLSIRSTANLHAGNSTTSLQGSTPSNGTGIHGYTMHPHNQMPVQQKGYPFSPKQPYVQYGQKPGQYVQVPKQAPPLRPQSQPKIVPIDMPKPTPSPATQTIEATVDADCSGATPDDGERADADSDGASSEPVKASDDGKLDRESVAS